MAFITPTTESDAPATTSPEMVVPVGTAAPVEAPPVVAPPMQPPVAAVGSGGSRPKRGWWRWVLVVVVVVAVGGGVYAWQHQQDQNDKSALQSQLNALSVANTKLMASAPVAVTRIYPGLAASALPQTLAIKGWNVQLVFPASTVIAPVYATLSTNVIGLADTNLTKVAANCTAAKGALGDVSRYIHGQFPTTGTVVFIATIGNYDYGYAAPAAACATTPITQATTQTDLGITKGALNTLASTQ